jgi:hypothetical protein
VPYQQIPLGAHVSPHLTEVIRGLIDEFFREFHFLLTVQVPDQGPKGSLQRPLAMLILAAADATAQFLYPGKMDNRDRFTGFLKSHYPWEIDTPEGLTIDEACEFLWEEARCPLVHRFGARAVVSRQAKPLVVKYGRVFAKDDQGVTSLELLVGQRPYSDPSIHRNNERTVLWIEAFYWSLRIAVQRALATPEQAAAVEAWIKSGKWDRSAKTNAVNNGAS